MGPTGVRHDREVPSVRCGGAGGGHVAPRAFVVYGLLKTDA